MKNQFTLKKHYIIAVILSLITGNISAQTPELWGMTQSGGQHNAGTIYKTDSNGTAVVQHSFKIDEANPSTSLLLAGNGKLYGMTSKGGEKNYGLLYEFNRYSNRFIKVVDFLGETNGAIPLGDLLLANNGKIYGVTSKGGISDDGTLFEFDPNTNTLTKVYDFDGTNTGSEPFSGLIQASDGKLYGVTAYGGDNDNGILFSYNLSTATLTKLYDFDGTNSGKNPKAKLLEASNGLLYGITSEGGNNDLGTIFQYDTANQSLQTLVHLTDFGNIKNAFIQANNGKLYATSTNNIFSFDPTTNTITSVYNIGTYNNYGLIQASNNILYGVFPIGGYYNSGFIFSFDINTQNFTELYDFNKDISGSSPLKQFIEINNKLYGVTSEGGEKNSGVIYSFDINNNTFQNLYNLKGSILGWAPNGKLLQISLQKFIGFTRFGGNYNKGTLFEYNKTNNTYRVLFNFDGTNGAEPLGTPLKASNGKYYGSTSFGGISDNGVFFEFDPNTLIYQKFDFRSYNQLTRPMYTEPVQVANGNIYGTVAFRGLYEGGAIYKYNPNTQNLSIVHYFESSTGKNPFVGLTLASNGKLIGQAKSGGANNKGVIFEFDSQSDTYNKLYDFEGLRKPIGKLIEVSNGLFYGGRDRQTTVLYEYNMNSNIVTNKVYFDLPTTGDTSGFMFEPCKGTNGLIYGVLDMGGSNDYGTLFSYDYNTDTFTKLFDFDNTNGAYPRGGLIEYNPTLSIVKNTFDAQIKVYPNPTKGFFKIAFDNEIKDITAVLLSIDGRIIETKNITKSNAIQFNIKQPNGIYFVHITNNTGKQAVIKVVKK